MMTPQRAIELFDEALRLAAEAATACDNYMLTAEQVEEIEQEAAKKAKEFRDLLYIQCKDEEHDHYAGREGG